MGADRGGAQAWYAEELVAHGDRVLGVARETVEQLTAPESSDGSFWAHVLVAFWRLLGGLFGASGGLLGPHASS